MEIIVVSGFLGAGKTTFIQKFVKKHQNYENRKFAILINEFGDIGVDGDILKNNGLEIIELPSGCICCSLRMSLPETIDRIFQEIKPDVLLIEPSGIATPYSVIEAIKNSKHAEKYRIKPLICVVDASAFQEMIGDFGKFYGEQIEAADVLLINKIDLVDDAELDKIEKRVQEINPSALTVRTSYCRTIPEVKEAAHKASGSGSDLDVFLETISISPVRHMSKNELEYAIQNVIEGRFGEVIRAKGFVNSDHMYLFQIFGKNYEIRIMKNGESGDVLPKAVFIGHNLDSENLRKLFG